MTFVTLESAVQILKEGNVVALPTETVYGLAANALNEAACSKIFTIKGRPLIDPLIVHISDIEQAAHLGHLTPSCRRLAQKFWPGPLTLIVPKNPIISDLITAGRASVGLRSPQHPLFRKVLELSELPLAAPSANPFGYISPTTAQHVHDSLGAVPILDGGPCTVGIESTILDMTNPLKPKLLRPGPISVEMIEDTIGNRIERTDIHITTTIPSLPAPGTLASHYSPNTPLTLLPAGTLFPEPASPNVAHIYFQRPTEVKSHTYWLSETGSAIDAARNLFSLLRALDGRGYRKLYMQSPPNRKDLSFALYDRMQRAAAKFTER